MNKTALTSTVLSASILSAITRNRKSNRLHKSHNWSVCSRVQFGSSTNSVSFFFLRITVEIFLVLLIGVIKYSDLPVEPCKGVITLGLVCSRPVVQYKSVLPCRVAKWGPLPEYQSARGNISWEIKENIPRSSFHTQFALFLEQ